MTLMSDSNKTVDLSNRAMNKTNSYCVLTTWFIVSTSWFYVNRHRKLIYYLLNCNILIEECLIGVNKIVNSYYNQSVNFWAHVYVVPTWIEKT